MKRIGILLAALCLAAAFSGCSEKDNTGKAEPVSATAESSQPAPESEEPAEKDNTGRAEPVSAAAESSQPAPESEEPAESELSDRIPMVMVNGTLYYDTGEESTFMRTCGTYDGEITSTVKRTEIPSEEDQSNFGAGYPYQYTDSTERIDLLIGGKWITFEQREGSGSQVRFGGRMVDAAGLSEETLEWLDWYNSLPADEQLKVSAIPPDLLTEAGIAGAEDAASTP